MPLTQHLHVACTEEIRNTYRILSESLKGMHHFGAGGRIILKFNFQE
jgi:hypothetical protein